MRYWLLSRILLMRSSYSKWRREWWLASYSSIYLLQIWHLAYVRNTYMCTNVKQGVLKYLLLQYLLLLLLAHLPLQKVVRSVCLFNSHRLSCPLILLKNLTQVFVFSVVFAALHFFKLIISIKLPIDADDHCNIDQALSH